MAAPELVANVRLGPAIGPARWARWLWLICAAAAAAALLLALPGYFQSARLVWPATGMLLAGLELLGLAASLAAALVSLALAVLLFWRRADDFMALYVSFLLLVYGIIMAGPLEHLAAQFPGLVDLTYTLQAVFMTGPVLVLLILFPNGRFVPSWARWLVPLTTVWTAALIILPPFSQWSAITTTQMAGLLLLYFLLPSATFAAQVYRYHRVSSLAERQQTRWVLYGFALWMGAIIVSSPQYVMMSSLSPGDPVPAWAPLGSAFWWLTLNIVPLSLTVAVLRYRLWDLYVVVNRTLVYGALTATLVLVYFGVVVVMQTLFRVLTGQESQLSVVVSTLAIAALFVPLRGRIQAFIDRRFYRSKYDARQALDAFAATARDEVELERLTEELLLVVRETMQPERVTLWLMTPTRAGRHGPGGGSGRPWYNTRS
jgi:hypothetical protein